jgi:hypothetical protein
MKIFLITISFLMTQAIHAQIHSTWKGGTPGHKTDWDTPANWSNNRVPDEFTDVVIVWDQTMQENYPLVKEAKFEVHSIWIHDGAKLNICYSTDPVIKHVNDGWDGPTISEAGQKQGACTISNIIRH